MTQLMAARAISPENHKYKSKIHPDYVKIINMISQKSHSLKLFLWKNIFVVGAGFCAAFLGLNINTNEASALFTPTLSASVDNAVVSVNGNQVINSTNKTTEIPLNLTVNTNNKTGYTATLSSETEDTALTNTTSTAGAKINSISSAGLLGDFSNNTWGYKFGASSNYTPIPALSTPAQILKTTGKTNGNESSQLSIGMKLSDNLESGRYTNKLVFSILTNNYEHIAIMTEGPDFNKKLISLETATNKIKYFKKSTVAPAASMNAVNIEDEESDYEIKLWLDPTDKTAYYYSEPEKVYLNMDSSKMFYSEYGTQKIKNILDLDLSNFDTSKVKRMDLMFYYRSSLTTLNLSNFDTSQVTNMSGMFTNMYNLTTLNLSNFNTSQVTNMRGMFSHMYNLTTLNLSNFDTSNVTDMTFMFTNMFNLTTLDLSNFDTSNVTDMFNIFSTNKTDTDKLETIYVNNDFNTSKLIYFSEMFRNRKKLRGGNGSYLSNPSTADKSWLRIDDPTHGRPGYFTRKP